MRATRLLLVWLFPAAQQNWPSLLAVDASSDFGVASSAQPRHPEESSSAARPQPPVVRAVGLKVARSFLPLARTVPERLRDKHDNVSGGGGGKFHYIKNDHPSWISAAAVASYQEDGPRLMAPPIHVQAGDALRVSVTNGMQDSGLSIHWHGFEMRGDNMVYDGVVGVTQCAIPPAYDDGAEEQEHIVDEEGNVLRTKDGGWNEKKSTFVYDFVVNEEPGTYWYHTHSGAMGLVDAVRGPLIVHPPGKEARELVDALNGVHNNNSSSSEQQKTVVDPLSYGDERILFLSDGFADPEHDILLMHMGGLGPPLSKNEDGFLVNTHPWEFGTVNGLVREVVTVEAGSKYRLRLINAGSIYALRFYIPGLKLVVIEADSNPVKPYECDEVVLHTAERFSIMIDVPAEFAGRTMWIRADTLESRALGYDNGIRAVLNAVAPGGMDDPLSSVDKDKVEDPPIGDDGALAPYGTAVNCYSQAGGSRCLPLTVLAAEEGDNGAVRGEAGGGRRGSFELHTIDIDFMVPPQFAHFVRLDGGPWVQNVDPGRSLLLPDHGKREGDLHPNNNVLHVGSWVNDMIFIWRNPDSMDHPIHLHGYKLEILDVNTPVRQRDCTLVRCKLNLAFSSDAEIERLRSLPHGGHVVKDTFVLPSGGAVATRVRGGTGPPGVWFAHCHMNAHREDGMAFVLNVGNYTPPANRSWLPSDYPDCDTPFARASTRHRPSCRCFDNQDSILGLRLKSSENYLCSRHHLCHHAEGKLSTLPRSKYPGGIRSHAEYVIPGWAISLLAVVASVAVIGRMSRMKKKEETAETAALSNGRTHGSGDGDSACGEQHCFQDDLQTRRRTSNLSMPEDEEKDNVDTAFQAEEGGDVMKEDIISRGDRSLSLKEEIRRSSLTRSFSLKEGSRRPSLKSTDYFARALVCQSLTRPPEYIDAISSDSAFLNQVKVLFLADWAKSRPVGINIMRIVEVVGTALLTGIAFYSVGANTTDRSLRESISLLFFSMTLWTFNRMYPAVMSYNEWRNKVIVDAMNRRYSIAAACLSRILVLIAVEAWWPFIYCFVCFPLAQIAGDVSVVFLSGVLLSLNLMCYISIGSLVGTVIGTVTWAMIAVDLFSQTTIVCAGFYTTLPPFLSAFRFVSPVFHAFSGIVKISYGWSDTFDCSNGDSELGSNKCFLEFSGVIEDLKYRGIAVATFGDPMSGVVWPEILALVCLYIVGQLLLFGFLWVSTKLLSPEEEREGDESNEGLTSTGPTDQNQPEITSEPTRMRQLLEKSKQMGTKYVRSLINDS